MMRVGRGLKKVNEMADHYEWPYKVMVRMACNRDDDNKVRRIFFSFNDKANFRSLQVFKKKDELKVNGVNITSKGARFLPESSLKILENSESPWFPKFGVSEDRAFRIQFEFNGGSSGDKTSVSAADKEKVRQFIKESKSFYPESFFKSFFTAPEKQPKVVKVPEKKLEVVKVSESQPEVVKVPEKQLEVVKVPESQPEVVKVPEKQPEVVKVPESQPKVVKVPEKQPKVVKVPESQPKVVKVPEKQPKVVKVPEKKTPVITATEGSVNYRTFIGLMVAGAVVSGIIFAKRRSLSTLYARMTNRVN